MDVFVARCDHVGFIPLDPAGCDYPLLLDMRTGHDAREDSPPYGGTPGTIRQHHSSSRVELSPQLNQSID